MCGPWERSEHERPAQKRLRRSRFLLLYRFFRLSVPIGQIGRHQNILARLTGDAFPWRDKRPLP
jgi:hypothetical protein